MDYIVVAKGTDLETVSSGLSEDIISNEGIEGPDETVPGPGAAVGDDGDDIPVQNRVFGLEVSQMLPMLFGAGALVLVLVVVILRIRKKKEKK